MDNNRDRQRRSSNGNANRVSGPTSALSSFLREHGIRVPNQSRRARREREEQQQQLEQQQRQQGIQDPLQEQQPQEEEVASNQRVTKGRTTTILYTPPGAATSSPASSIASSSGASGKKKGKKRARKGTKKKGKKDSDDDDSDFISDDEEDDFASDDYKPSTSSRRALAPGRAIILFCVECKQRFARKKDEDESITTCLNCRNGGCNAAANKKKAPIKKRRNIPIVQKQNLFVAVPSLQDLCIGVVAKYIDQVDSFGFISDDSFNKLAKIISRNRKLNDQTSKLFMEPYRKHLKLYDCTSMTEDAFVMLSQFCYQLERLELVYCGRIRDKVLENFAERLHHLKALSLSGAFLITKEAWMAFFKNVGPRLEAFELRHSARFDKDCMKVLVECCPNLTSLKFGHLGQMDTDWLELIGRLKHLNILELAWLSEGRSLQTQDVVDLLGAVGKNLVELAICGGPDLTDEVLTTGLLKNCHQLKKLTLENCDLLTSGAMAELFTQWQMKTCLTHLNIARCLLMEDDALKAIIDHSGKTLECLNIHSLEKLTTEGLEYIVSESLTSLNCGFVRSMDDFVLVKLTQNCPRLKDIQVWGCHALTENVTSKSNLRITGKEMSVLQELAMLKQF